MHYLEETKHKLQRAHIVRDIEPKNYLTKFRNIFELLEYRVHSHPDQTYIIFYPDDSNKIVMSYKQFSEKVFKTADLLKSNGIGVEDRISTISHNHLNTVIQYFAAWCIGATVVPVNVNEEADRIKYILESSETKLVFVHKDYVNIIEKIKPDLPALQRVYIQGSGEDKTHYPVYDREVEKHLSEFKPDEAVNEETEALIVYTSGTTGLPKGVVLTQYNLLADAYGISKWHKMEREETMMCVLPIHHVNGTVVTLVTPMYYGGTVVLNQKFHTHNFFKRLAVEKVQVVSVVPTLLQYLCHDYESGKDRDFFHVYEEQLIANFRHIICGAGPLTCELAEKFEEIFRLKIIHGYGLSETTCYSCFLPIDLTEREHKSWLNDYGFPSIGAEIETNEMDIHDDKGKHLGENERGEIVIRGHNVMKCYDKNPEANAKTFEFGWFRSGDEGFYKLDTQGRKFFFITGRIKELIIRGGVNISPLEIDEVLMSIPEVKAGIAVGFDNDWYGEEVGALIQIKPEVKIQMSEDEIKKNILKQCREKLPAYKCPKIIVFSDSIPVTSTGKYQRNKVRHLFKEFKSIQYK